MFVMHALLGLIAAFAPQNATPAAAPADEFTTKEMDGVTVRFDKSIEITPQDLDALLSSLRRTRDILKLQMGIVLPFEPTVTIRRKAQSKRGYFTKGDDQIEFDFPSDNYVTRLQPIDERVFRYAAPCMLQLWLDRSLTTMAGLDPRILESLKDYATWLFRRELAKTSPGVKVAEGPDRLGSCWHQFETIYPGMTSFLLNNIATMKIPAHLLGDKIREIAVALTDDQKIGALFDLIAPSEPLLAREDAAPGAPLDAASALRTSRLALFNGVPLLDVESESLAPARRQEEFERLYIYAISLAPDASIRREPPAIRNLDLWQLYFEFLPRVMRASDTIDYLLVLREFLARFQDRAFSFAPSPAFRVTPGTPYWNLIPGTRFERVGDRVFVKSVAAESAAAKAGLIPGLEIVSVDGRPTARVLELLAGWFRTFDSCPSRQRADAAAADLVLSGPRGSTASIVVRDASAAAGAPKQKLEIPRDLPLQPNPPQPVEAELRADQVGVLRINYFSGDSFGRFAKALDDLAQKGAKGIVLDLRGNEGMVVSSAKRPSLAMLGRLLPAGSEPVVIGSAFMRSKGDFEKPVSEKIVIEPAPGGTRFQGGIALLIDAWTGGEAEWFALGFQLAKLGTVMGQPSGGSVSSPKPFEAEQSLPYSKVDIGFSLSMVFKPDGTMVQTVGVRPQVAIDWNPADLAAGRDTQIERAAQFLLTGK